MKVSYSNNEVSIEGTREELKQFSDSLQLNCNESMFAFQAEQHFDSSPYENICTSIKFSQSSKNNIYIEEHQLIFSGSAEFFLNFALNIPFNSLSVPYHIHYDAISFPQFIEGCLTEVIISAV